MARAYCEKCERPASVCVCQYVVLQDNSVPIFVLMHEDESDKALNTVRILRHALSNIKVLCGTRFKQQDFREWQENLGLNSTALLYPKPLCSSVQHLECQLASKKKRYESADFYDPQTGIDSLLVLDGTWRNTRELILMNDWVKCFNTLSVEGKRSSQYRIRKSNIEGSLSTIEAVAGALSVLDSTVCTETLLRPFYKMIDIQIAAMGQDTFLKNYVN